jgi:hypothetical protein
MKFYFSLFIFLISLSFSTGSYASLLWAISDTLRQVAGIQANLLHVQGLSLAAQQDIDNLMQEVNGHMVGNSGWGTYQFKDYQSYGEAARDWSNVMRMAENDQGSGELGGMINTLGSQFPSNPNIFNKGINDADSQKYYALQSQTVLATRAASQLDYNKIQDQIVYQQMLQQQIEKTRDLKAAMDLSNRIQVEGNLINLEILRQVALSNQQQAVTEQATVNAALSNARFLTKDRSQPWHYKLN